MNYVANMRILFKKMKGEVWDFNLDFFMLNAPEIGEYLIENFKLSTAQNYLSSIIISLQAHDEAVPQEYTTLMKKNGEILRTESNKQTKSVKDDANWTSIKALRKHLNVTKKALDLRGVFSKDFTDLTYFERNLMRDWVVGSLYIGDDKNPPIRADYCMKVISATEYKDVDKSENYLVVKGKNTKYFHLGKYKTESHYGEKVLPVGSKLNKVLNLYLKVHKESDFLIYTNRGKAVTPDTLAKLVPEAFKNMNKHITINLLRHIYISEMLPSGGPDLNEKGEVADKMLHSVGLQEQYKKLK
tara:strand:+ start:420 stop:1319 length:900 start_codon:yes stop_codon:yes gene_type:complete